MVRMELLMGRRLDMRRGRFGKLELDIYINW